MSDFQTALRHVLMSEGGFVNNPKDPGGMTNLGVTARTWEDWVGHAPSEKEMRELTPEKVAPLYKRKYWDAIKGDDLPNGISYCVFDCAVNSGPGRAVKLLQQAIGVNADGAIGHATLATVRAHCVTPEDTKALITDFCNNRLKFWQSLNTFATFGAGWTRRGNEVKEAALKMV